MKIGWIMNIRRMFLGMAVLCGFSVSAAAEGHFDKLSDRVKEVPEPVVEGTVVRQEGSGKGKLIDDVNVFGGTDGFGNVYPGPQVPFGGIRSARTATTRTMTARRGTSTPSRSSRVSASRI